MKKGDGKLASGARKSAKGKEESKASPRKGSASKGKVKPEGPKPKKAISAYFFYTKVAVPKIKQEFDNMSQAQAMKEAGRRWNELTEKEKEPYEKQH